jgi:hypothetical protein
MRGEGAYRFVCGSRGRDLARANRVAEWVAALLWAICFRERRSRLDQRPCVVNSRF